MYFDMYGPFDVGRPEGQVAPSQTAMWAEVRKKCRSYNYEELELEQGIGCYAFGLRWGDTLTPWYVGMTIAKGGFRREVFHLHKRDHYNAVLAAHRGTPVMFLMPLMTEQMRFSRDRSGSETLIQWVEKLLFGAALRRNLDCRNQRDTRFLREVVVNGLFNSAGPGRPERGAAAARRMFGMEGG